MIKNIVTEILEEDFRKLDIKVSKTERTIDKDGTHRFDFVDVSLNDILDLEIKALLESGTEEDRKWLDMPVTIAIHEPGYYYLDKFMNRFSGAQTYQLGFGIGHLYSTRDYYEARGGDYWRVAKKETKVIYRVKLSDVYKEKFILKHKKEIKDWPYDILPEDVSPDYDDAKLEIHYDLVNDEFVEAFRLAVFYYPGHQHIVSVDKEGRHIKPDWEK